MIVLEDILALRKHLDPIRTQRQTIGFVPTMGALHEGHISLLKAAREKHDCVVMSIFVNPLQFLPTEDFASYPRPRREDEAKAKAAGVDVVFYPHAAQIYPHPPQLTVKVGALADVLCGVSRPGHFDGVATVVLKLLNVVSPTTLFLGQKDAQQALIIKRLLEDFNLTTELEVCPTFRETSGLAMSSRNQYLSDQERQEACWLFKSLKEAKDLILKGERDIGLICSRIKENIAGNTSGCIDYVECLSYPDLARIKTVDSDVLLAVAVTFGQARLIDNMIFSLVN